MWTLTNRQFAEKHFSHFIYQSGNQFAIADHSIRDLSDPSSTDDGLLLLDDSRPVAPLKPELFYDGNYFIPVTTKNGEQSTVIAPLCTVYLIRKLKEGESKCTGITD